jgi:hypothetical protein
MPTTNVSRQGQVNGAGDARALFLKVFSGETFTTFNLKSVMRQRHMVRTITNGKSAQFPVTGIATADYHTIGTNILDPANGNLNNIKHNEKVIAIDDKLMSNVLISDVDDAINHYDVASVYSEEIGNALANQFDGAVIKVVAAAARQDSTIDRDGYRTFGGSRVYSDAAGGSEGADDFNMDVGATFATGTLLADALHRAKIIFDKKNIPSEGRTALVDAEDYGKLVSEFSDVTQAKILNGDIGGEGSYAAGTLGRIAGFEIVQTNNMPNGADLSAVTTGDGASNNDVFGAEGSGYNGDFTGTRILCFHKSAVGTVILRDMSTEMDWKSEYQADLLIAKYLLGHGVLRPECALEISDGNKV